MKEFLGDARIAFDDMCDRAPEGEVEIVPTCFRIIQHSNWKIFLENQLDALHPSVTHELTGRAAEEVEHEIEKRKGHAPLDYHYLSAFTLPFHKWDTVQTVNHRNGHCILQGYMGLRPQDPDTLAYEAAMRKHYGKERTEEILGVNIHHVLLYPGLSVQPPLQQLRAVRPLSVDRTLTEIWHFRLKGAPEAIYRRALGYYNLVNSPSTMVNADDLENFWRCHQGLSSERRRLGELPPPRRAGRCRGRRGEIALGHERGADAQPVPRLGRFHGDGVRHGARQGKKSEGEGAKSAGEARRRRGPRPG